MEREIFKKGSTTYYWSSKFFPPNIRADVYKLYSFVRIVDDYVDAQPQQKQAFYKLREAWNIAEADVSFNTSPVSGEPVHDRILKNMIAVSRKHDFDPAWTTAFLDAMQSDLRRTEYKTIGDTIVYMHGSAEVIGLMMCKIMGVDHGAYGAAILQGRAMQYINFIRDIAEDVQLGRCYFPKEELKRFGLSDLAPETAAANPAAFEKFIHAQLAYYREWQRRAEEAYHYLPKRLLIPLRVASQMYQWTAVQIEAQPLKIYRAKIKPTRTRVILTALRLLCARWL